MLSIDINKTGVENVLALITENNPDLPITLTPENVELTNVPGEITGYQDTSPSISDLPISMVWVPTLNKFLGSGTAGRIYVSDDGLTWNQTQSLPGAGLLTLVYSTYHQAIIAHGQSGKLFVSTDGDVWTERTTPTITGNITMVAVSEHTGSVLLGIAGNANLYESSDLLQSITLKRSIPKAPVNLVWLPSSPVEGDQFFIVGDNTSISVFNATSNVLHPASVQGSFAANNVAVSTATNRVIVNTTSANTGIWISDNAIDGGSSTWDFIETETTGYNSVVYVPDPGTFVIHRNGPGVVLVTDAGGVVYKNDNKPIVTNVVTRAGSAELVMKLGWFFAKTTDLTDTYFDGTGTNYGGLRGDLTYLPSTGETAIVGAPGIAAKLGTSGLMEFEMGNAPGPVMQLAYSPSLDLYMAAGTSATTPLAISQDLVNWTACSVIGSCNAVMWMETLELFVVGNGNVLLTSPDGLVFTPAFTANNPIQSITYSTTLNTILAVGDAGGVYASQDGIQWNVIPFGALGNTKLSKVDWSPTLEKYFIGNDSALFSSVDGVTWVKLNLPIARYRPTWIDDLSMLVVATNGSGKLYMSTDGEVFESHLFSNFTIGINNVPQNIVYNVQNKRLDFLGNSNVLITIGLEIDAASKVLVSAIQDKGYKNSVEVSYYRPTIENIAGPAVAVDPIILDTSLHDPVDPQVYQTDSLSRIAAQLGLRVSDVRVIGAIPVPVDYTNPLTVRLTAVEGSFIYAPVEYVVRVTIPVIEMDVVIPNPTLVGFSI